jgi:hypothetical protein
MATFTRTDGRVITPGGAGRDVIGDVHVYVESTAPTGAP